MMPARCPRCGAWRWPSTPHACPVRQTDTARRVDRAALLGLLLVALALAGSGVYLRSFALTAVGAGLVGLCAAGLGALWWSGGVGND